MNYQRLAIGILAALSLLVGGALYFLSSGESSITTGLLVRVGALLGVIWLAMPQLETLKTKISTVAFFVVLLILIVAATKPKLFPIISGILAISLTLNWALRWLSQFSDPPKP
jgi:hypothetical protein